MSQGRLPSLFPEIYEYILCHLPVRQGCSPDTDASPRTLIACIETGNRTLRSIASLPHVWRPHYLARWKHSSSSLDEMVELFRGDYRLMYHSRRNKDRRALELLDKVIARRSERYERSNELIDELGYDVWDVLESGKVDIPRNFRRSSNTAPDWYARNHWIKEVLCVLTRRDAVKRALKLSRGSTTSIEEGFSIYSGFWGIEHDQINELLDNLARACKDHLLSTNHILDVSDRHYDRVANALEICSWMRFQGFGPAVDSYHDLRNHYIHKVLTSHRMTLPLSLVAVFVAICRRLGIPASGVSFPKHVHAFVPVLSEPDPRSPWIQHYDARNGGVHLDIYNSATEPFIDVIGVLRRGLQDELKPASTHELVFRVGRNILTSAQLRQGEVAAWELDLSVYAVFCVFLMERQVQADSARDFVQHILAIVSQSYPLDVGPILEGVLLPVLSGQAEDLMRIRCESIVKTEKDYMLEIERNPVRYFAGLVFVHRIFDYIAVVLEGDDHCHASNAWIVRFGIDALERGRNQPFYSVCAADGSSRYVAEDNIIPIAQMVVNLDPEFSAHRHRTGDDILRNIVEGFPGLGAHFLKPMEGIDGRLVFIPHAESLARYPGDLAKLDRYLVEGVW